ASPAQLNNNVTFFHHSRDRTRHPLFPYTTLFRSAGATGGRARKKLSETAALRCVGERRDRGRQRYGAAGVECRIEGRGEGGRARSEEHTSELQSRSELVCRLLLEKKKALVFTGIF